MEDKTKTTNSEEVLVGEATTEELSNGKGNEEEEAKEA